MGQCFVIGGQDDWFNSVLISSYLISCSNLYCDWGVVGAFRGLDDAVAGSEAECNMGATMTWGSSVLTGGWGCRSFLGFVHPSKGAHLRQQSVLNCGREKSWNQQNGQEPKPARAKGGRWWFCSNSARFKHLSRGSLGSHTICILSSSSMWECISLNTINLHSSIDNSIGVNLIPFIL